MAQFAGNANWAEPSPLFAHRARPTPLKCKNEYLVLALGEETAVQAVVGSIVWAFRNYDFTVNRNYNYGLRFKIMFSVVKPNYRL